MIAIISDIHGNYPALLAVLNDMPKVDAIFALGDLIGELPFPCEVMDKLIDINAIIIKGNREEDLLKLLNGELEEWKTTNQFGTFIWTLNKLSKKHIDVLTNLPLTTSYDAYKFSFLLAHGSPTKTRDTLINIDKIKSYLKPLNESVLVVGHTHLLRKFYIEDKIFISAGSVGISLDRIPEVATYVLFDEEKGKVYFRYVHYDIDLVEREMKLRGINNASPTICEAVRLEMRTGIHHMLSLVKFSQDLMYKKIGKRELFIPYDIWKQAEYLWDRSPFVFH